VAIQLPVANLAAFHGAALALGLILEGLEHSICLGKELAIHGTLSQMPDQDAKLL